MKNLLTSFIVLLFAFTVVNLPVAEARDFEKAHAKFENEIIGLDTNNNGKLTRGEVRRALKDLNIDPATTCLDDYAKRSRNLMIGAGLTPPVGAGVSVGGFIGVAYGTALATVGTAGLGALILALVFGYLAFIGLVAGTLTWEVFTVAKLVRNNFVLKAVAEAHLYKEKQILGKSLTKFMKKYKRKYKGDADITDAAFADLLVKADEDGSLCNGKVSGSNSKRLRKRLAKKKDIFRYIHRSL